MPIPSISEMALEKTQLPDYYWAIRHRRPELTSRTHKPHLLFIAMMVSTSAISACSAQSRAGDRRMMPIDQMPAAVQSAPTAVREAYQFAAANADLMREIPCYCGCVNIGHTSNFSCYVSGGGDSGLVTFDEHALNCSTCVDITQDAMRMLKEGRTSAEIKAYVDATYVEYGRSTMP